MSLNDSKFYKKKVKNKGQKASARQIQAALSPTQAYEAAFDILAQMAAPSRCNCESMSCERAGLHRAGGCKNQGGQAKAVGLGTLCDECAKSMPTEYLLPPHGTARGGNKNAQAGGPMMPQTLGAPMSGGSGGGLPIEQQINELKGKGFTDQQVKEVIKVESDKGNNPDGTRNRPVDDSYAPLYSEDVHGTGNIVSPKFSMKMAQAVPLPPAPPAGGPPGAAPPPPGGAPEEAVPPMGDDMGDEEDGVVDERSLEEALEDLKSDVEAIEEKVEAGETILHGEDVEPVEGDSGPPPGPPGKVAVDQPAKEYYHDLYGDFGDELARDRVAETLDIIDEAAEHYKTALTTKQVQDLLSFLFDMEQVEANSVYAKAAAVAAGNSDFANALDRIMINFMFKCGAVFNPKIASEHKPALFVTAINSADGIADRVFKYINAADPKMKQPKVKGQPDDKVKHDKLEDEAEKGDHMLARPGHLPMEVTNHKQEGIYTKYTVRWDPDHPAAARSSTGMEQAVVSFMKGLESEKEFKDLGFAGQFQLEVFDPEAGFAVAYFRSRSPSDAPEKVVTETDKKDKK